MSPLTRRSMLTVAGGASAVLLATEAATGAVAPTLDLSNPAAQVRAFLKLNSSLVPETLFHLYAGTLEALVPGRAPVMLTASTSIVRRQVELLAEGHLVSLWEATVYHRAGETEPLDSFVNPLNGRTVRPFHQREGRGQTLWTTNGPQILRDGQWVSGNRSGKPFALEWFQADGRIWTSRWSSGVYLKNPLDAEKWPLESTGPDLLYSEKTTNSGPLRELADPSVMNASSTYSLNQTMLWWPWLLMGQQPGYLVWNTQGVKLRTRDSLPAASRKMIEKVHPTILGAAIPWDGHVSLWTDYPKMRTPERP